MKQVLIILRGAPGSGKTTIAKALRNKEEKIVWVATDHLKPMFCRL